MKHILNIDDFINEARSYRSYEDSLKAAFMKTGIQNHTYNNEFRVSGSGWPVGHPDGSVGVTFWMMDYVEPKELIKTAKKWAKQNGLRALTFYPDGVEENDPSRQNWGNAAAQNAKYVYGFTFKGEGGGNSVYTPLK